MKLRITMLCWLLCTGAALAQPYPPGNTRPRIFVHLMPWFETKATNTPANTWGIHWTMATAHPDVIDGDGKRQIASLYYPLTGPYASGDTALIEYQLLLMQYSGIDGVLIDWPGILQHNDYPLLVRNTEKIVSVLQRTRLHFAIVYEDHNINITAQDGALHIGKIDAARADMAYLQAHFFTLPSYERLNGQPMLLNFGPQTFEQPAAWSRIFDSLQPAPAFFPLWDHDQYAGANAAGTFAWINEDHTVSLQKYYAEQDSRPRIASAYPGFESYYGKGGWDGPKWSIAHTPATFNTTLDLALQSKLPYIQLPTWNDYGEGTTIEPTREYRYAYLTLLQRKLGVPFTQRQLELVTAFYNLRRHYAGNAQQQKKLDAVFAQLANGDVAGAEKEIKAMKKGR